VWKASWAHLLLGSCYGLSCGLWACGGAEQGQAAATPANASQTQAPGAAPVAPVETTTTAVSGAGAGTKLAPAASAPPVASSPAPAASAGGGGGEPGRAPDDIAAAMKARRDEIRACYDKAVKDHPGIEGDLHVRFVIDPKGRVKDAHVDKEASSIEEPALDKCVTAIVKQLHFADSAKGLETRAHYPFRFIPKPAAPGATP
jgi:TonB family protein